MSPRAAHGPRRGWRSLPAAPLLAAVLIASALDPASAAARPSNAAVASRIAGELRCQAFTYEPGPNSASSSQGMLDCRTRRQHYIVYVFASNRDRSHGIAHVKLWSGPDVYFFAKDKRAVIVPRGDYPRPPHTKRWAKVAADRTGGVVFSG